MLVYAHVDPRTELPFYIGKGTLERANDFRRRSNFHKKVSEKIFSCGMKPLVRILHDNLTEDQAFEKEQIEISFYGRRNNGTGILVNLTDGGEGPSGFLHSEDAKIRIGAAKRGKTWREISEKRKPKPAMSSETIEKMQRSRAAFVKRQAQQYLEGRS